MTKAAKHISLIVFSLFSLFSCSTSSNLYCQVGGSCSLEESSKSTSMENDTSYQTIQSLIAQKQAFVVIVHALWCPECKDTLPFAVTYFQDEEKQAEKDSSYQELKGLFLNANTMSLSEKNGYFAIICQALPSDDDAKISNSFLIPDVALFKDGKVAYAQTHIGGSQEIANALFNEIKGMI